MRTILTFSVLLLALCVGCPSTDSKPIKNQPVEPAEIHDHDKIPPLVEPMSPQRDEPAEDSAPAPETTVAPETTAILSEALEKFADEAVPLPPLEDLTAQIDYYITKIGTSLEGLDGSPKYAEDAADIIRDANASALIALAIGLAEGDSKYKKSAPLIIASAKTLAAAKNLDEGQKAYTALKASLTGQGTGRLAWTDKVADLKPAMKALPNLSSAVRRVSDTENKLDRFLGNVRGQEVYSQTAAMATIAQGCIPNVAETTKPDAAAEWKKHCEEFRDLAIKTNAAAHQYAKDKADGKTPNYAAFDTSFKAMSESCDSCHKDFYPSAVGQHE